MSVGKGWGMAGLFSRYRRRGCSGSGSRGTRWEGEGREEGPRRRGSVEGGGPHLVKAHFRRMVARTPERNSLGRVAQPVLALTCVLTDVNTVGKNQTNVCSNWNAGGWCFIWWIECCDEHLKVETDNFFLPCVFDVILLLVLLPIYIHL